MMNTPKTTVSPPTRLSGREAESASIHSHDSNSLSHTLRDGIDSVFRVQTPYKEACYQVKRCQVPIIVKADGSNYILRDDV